MKMSSDTIAAQLESYFECTDLLQILFVKNKEAYLNAPQDPFTGRVFLRAMK